MLVDVSYFTHGPRHIENVALGQSNAQVRAVVDSIESYIARYEPEFLEIAGLTYELVNGFPTQYQELVKESIADYVMFFIARDCGQHTSITGVKVLKVADKVVSPANVQCRMWNDMVDRMRKVRIWYLQEYGSVLNVHNDLRNKIFSL